MRITGREKEMKWLRAAANMEESQGWFYGNRYERILYGVSFQPV